MFFTIMSRVQSLTETTILKRTYHNKARTKRNNLYSRISPLGAPGTSLVPVLDKWVEEGKEVKEHELRRVIKGLRFSNRCAQALEVSGWMSSKGLCKFSLADHAVQLDLIGRVRGLDSAEKYFKNMDDEYKTEKIYGALLNCYVRESLVEKSLSHLQKMTQLGFAATALNYIDLMCLYLKAGMHEKVPEVLLEMKKNGLSPDIFSYRLCMRSYAERSDIESVEKILEEMESQPHIYMDWLTYAAVANIYIKAGLKNRAFIYLKKCEEKVVKDTLGFNHLISLNASLGNKEEVMRLWGLAKAKCKKQVNRDYITMLGSLLKLGELEEAEKLLEEWESSCRCHDFRVPNVLLIWYSKNGLIEKADTRLREIVKKHNTATPDSWAIIAAGYVNKQNMEKAFECTKEALAVLEMNKGWRPKPNLISSVLKWLGNNKDTEEVEAFVCLLETKVPKNRDMYHALIKAYVRVGKEVDGLLESMKTDKIDEDEETTAILSSMTARIMNKSQNSKF